MFTRRTATVTTSAPDTSIAFRVSAKSLYFPVPTQRRDLNSRPAITKRSSYIGPSPFHSLAEDESPAADKAQNFHPIARVETSELEVLPIKDFQVQFHGDTLGLDIQFPQQIADGRA